MCVSKLMLAVTAAAALACSGPAKNDCTDGIDNDGDGFVDGDDVGCDLHGTAEHPDPVDASLPPAPACADGVDNDADGLIDFPDDPGCDSAADDEEYDPPPTPACADGIDNDSDGRVDHREDPGCDTPTDDDEADDCPDGLACPACADGVDNDGDNLADHPDDPGCAAPSDRQEADEIAGACGDVVTYALPPAGVFRSVHDSGGVSALRSPACNGFGSEIALAMTVAAPVAVVATTVNPATELDTVVYLRRVCEDPATELACNDDANGTPQSTVQVDRLEPGDHYLIVDTFSLESTGPFQVQVHTFTPEGEPCDPAADPSECLAGLECRLEVPTAEQPTCVRPECDDGNDNDGDGTSDYPSDPGCSSADDTDEADDCPAGELCPHCANDADDDGDGLVDYPDDPGCSAASGTSELECVPGVPLLELDPEAGATGTTTGPSALTASCSSGTASAAEAVYAFELTRTLASLGFSTVGSTFDAVTSVRFEDCGSAMAEVACQQQLGGGEVVTVSGPALGTYFVVVDGASSSGAYTLTASGTIASGDACDPDSAAFACVPGYICDPGTQTCAPTRCNNGADDDGDERIDAADPGCASETDDTEAPNPEPPPGCADGVDNDGDTLIDFGDDPGCSRASDETEAEEPDPSSDPP